MYIKVPLCSATSARVTGIIQVARLVLDRRVWCRKGVAECERLPGCTMLLQASQFFSGFGSAGSMVLPHPPQHYIRLLHALEPFSAPTHDLDVFRTKNKSMQGGDIAP